MTTSTSDGNEELIMYVSRMDACLNRWFTSRLGKNRMGLGTTYRHASLEAPQRKTGASNLKLCLL